MTGVLVASWLFVGSLQAPVADTSNSDPKQGETVQIRYYPKRMGALLRTADPIYMVAMVGCEDISTLTVPIKMTPEGDAWKADLKVPAQAAHIEARFVTLQAWDSNQNVTMNVHRADGKFARSARVLNLGPEFKKEFAEEMALYPDNYFAYRFKWFNATAFDKDNLDSMVKADLAVLDKVKSPPADLLAAQVYGRFIVKNEEGARAALKELDTRFPTAKILAFAFSDYQYFCYAQSYKGPGKAEMETLFRAAIARNVTQPDYRRHLPNLAYMGQLPVDVADKAAKAWIAEEPKNPWPYAVQAFSRLKTGVDLPTASKQMEEATNLLIGGWLRLYADLAGTLQTLETPFYFRVSAEIELKLGNGAKALGAIKAAQAIDRAPSPEHPLIEGRIWESIGNRRRATTAYEEALRRGNEEAEAPLHALYDFSGKPSTEWTTYLQTVKEGDAAPQGARRDKAPEFTAKALDGKTYDLKALKGKVVVLNFWFIGCAPCRVEMPALNKLVDGYKRQDVVFLAFALDKEEDLRKFLKEMKFDYTIVAEGAVVAGKYGVTSFPGHVVIGKDGTIVSHSLGGSDTIDKSLGATIRAALKG